MYVHALFAREDTTTPLTSTSGGCHSKCAVTIIATVFSILAVVGLGAAIYFFARRRRAYQPRARRLSMSDEGPPPPVPMKQYPDTQAAFTHHQQWTGSPGPR